MNRDTKNSSVGHDNVDIYILIIGDSCPRYTEKSPTTLAPAPNTMRGTLDVQTPLWWNTKRSDHRGNNTINLAPYLHATVLDDQSLPVVFFSLVEFLFFPIKPSRWCTGAMIKPTNPPIKTPR